MTKKQRINGPKRARTSGPPTAATDRPVTADERSRRGADANQLSTLDLPDLWGHGSFPASDPPANW